MSEHSAAIRKAAKHAFNKAKSQPPRDGVKPVRDGDYNAFRKGFQAGYWHALELEQREHEDRK